MFYFDILTRMLGSFSLQHCTKDGRIIQCNVATKSLC